ncbi:MAG: hypothetical protein J6V55_01520 [Alistipes sp.]|nr:hypothetical protein [Alistipes sp.]
MNRLLRFLSLALVVMLGGCTAMMESSSYGSSDLYITNNRIKVAEELTARAEAQKAEAEARKAMWEARLAEAEYYAATEGENYNTILADDYESAYARRLYGFNSPTYRLPASYYNLSISDAMRYASAYDPAFYNIMVSGDQVWVEPKYVTSMFGTWGATNITFGFYTSPFYYTMWGYPHYSWYDWNWNMCYNPYHWGWGYYAGYYPGYYPYYHSHYYPHHHHHYPHPPQYRPDHKPGGGNKYLTSDRRHSSSRYTSPVSNKNYGKNLNGGTVGTSIRNSGTTSSGMNSSRINAGTSGSSSRYSTTSGRSTTKSNSSSNSNFRSSSSSSRSTVSSSSSSSSKSNSSSSNFRSSSSSSSRSTGSSSSSSTFRSSGSSSSSRSSSGGGATSSRR